MRPHSVSPFLRSIRRRLEDEGNEEEIDLEAISCLLDFSTRERGGGIRPQTPSQSVVITISSFKVEGASGSEESSVMVRTFTTSPPATPAAAPRPERPPPVISAQRRHSGHLVRPRPLRRSAHPAQEEEELRHTCHSCVQPRPLRRNAPPAAALGAPPAQEEEEDREDIELPDLPETPASPATSDLTVIRLVKICCCFNNFLNKYFFMLLMIFVYFLAPPARPLSSRWNQMRSTSPN